MDKLILFVYLILCSWQDIRRKEISVGLLFGGMAAAVFYKVLTLSHFNFGILSGMLPGTCLLVFSRITGEAIGYGDGVLVLTIGILTGAGGALGVLWLALFLAAGFSVFGLIRKRCKRNSTYPFAPFLLLAWTLMWVGGFI